MAKTSGGRFGIGGVSAVDREIMAMLASDTASMLAGSPMAGLVPEGRAPRGMGGEYAARRRASKRIGSMERNLASLQNTSSNYRGQRNGRYAETIRRARIGQLRDGLDTIYKVMEGGGDWAFKAEMANGIADHVTAFNGALLR